MKTIKYFLAIIAVLFCLSAHADEVIEAKAAAVADGVTTYVALQAGAVEGNPFMPSSPIGILATTMLKVAVVDHLPKEAVKPVRSIWGGAAVNNLFIIAGAAPVAIPAGIIAGVYLWFH